MSNEVIFFPIRANVRNHFFIFRCLAVHLLIDDCFCSRMESKLDMGVFLGHQLEEMVLLLKEEAAVAEKCWIWFYKIIYVLIVYN